jgi:methylglutaconyl-CoA hydratase
MTNDVLLESTPAPGIRRLELHRPERRNALNDALIAALRAAIARAAEDPAVRVLVLAAAGAAFCAGADLAGMAASGLDTEDANRRDAEALAALLLALRSSPKPVVALVQGPAFGGGVGLAAACDVTIASTAVKFRLPEVQLGIVPAVISPHVIEAIGVRQARRLFLTAETVDAAWARDLGLVHEVVPPEVLESRGLELARSICAGGPHALATCKRLIEDVAHARVDAELAGRTARVLAALRAGDEAQEGLAAARDKRPAAWQR